MDYNCDKHRSTKIFCIEKQCQYRLDCSQCILNKRTHQGHKYIVIDRFLDSEVLELKNVFGSIYCQQIKNHLDDPQKVKQQLSKYFNKKIDVWIEEVTTVFVSQLEAIRNELMDLIDNDLNVQNVYQKKSVEQIQQDLKDVLDDRKDQAKQVALVKEFSMYKDILDAQDLLSKVMNEFSKMSKKYVDENKQNIESFREEGLKVVQDQFRRFQSYQNQSSIDYQQIIKLDEDNYNQNIAKINQYVQARKPVYIDVNIQGIYKNSVQVLFDKLKDLNVCD